MSKFTQAAIPEMTTEECWEQFWKEIVFPGGKLDLEQIKKELHDFHTLIDNVSLVYDHITCGRISKPLTDPKIVIDEAESIYQDGLRLAQKDWESSIGPPY